VTVEQDIERRAGDRVGSVLRGKYRLERLLGVGGMGSVFAAVHQNNRNKVAIKMLHAELSVNSEIRGRFLREGYIANTVEHPGVVRVLDDDTTEDGAVFLVLDLLEGETLANKLDAVDKLGATETTRIAIDLLEILSAAHEKGIVHRDIKPDNVFLTKNGAIRILDFGIARLREAATSGSTTRSGHSVGTPAYMAPEQALGHTKKLGPHSDVWSVGATMFTLLTGKFVHQAESVSELLIRAATQPVKPIEDAVPGIPLPLAKVINKSLAFEIADRYPTADAMRRDLMAALSSTQARVRASSPQFAEESSPTDEEIERANTEPPPPMPVSSSKRALEPTLEERAATVSAPTPVIAMARSEAESSGPAISVPRRSPPVGLIVGGAVLVLAVVAGGVVLSQRGSERTTTTTAAAASSSLPSPPTPNNPQPAVVEPAAASGAKIDLLLPSPPTTAVAIPTSSTPKVGGQATVTTAPKASAPAVAAAVHSAPTPAASARPIKPNTNADPMDRQ
jgi:serine/threonine protein kinase